MSLLLSPSISPVGPRSLLPLLEVTLDFATHTSEQNSGGAVIPLTATDFVEIATKTPAFADSVTSLALLYQPNGSDLSDIRRVTVTRAIAVSNDEGTRQVVLELKTAHGDFRLPVGRATPCVGPAVEWVSA